MFLLKLTKDQETRLTELAFAEKSNKEIAQELGIELSDIHAARSKLGITIPKVKQALEKGFNPSCARTQKEIIDEIEKVENSLNQAERKKERCNARLTELYKSLLVAEK